MTKAEALAVVKEAVDNGDVEFARKGVETLLLQIPQIGLDEDDREWFDQIANTYDIKDLPNSMFALGWLTGLAERMGVWDEA